MSAAPAAPPPLPLPSPSLCVWEICVEPDKLRNVTDVLFFVLVGTFLICLCVICRCFVVHWRRARQLSRQRSRDGDDKNPTTPTPNNPATPAAEATLQRTTTIRRQASGKVTIEAEEDVATKPGTLPDGWQAQEDADGNRYFFNSMDREMSWTQPTVSTGSAAAAGPYGVGLGSGGLLLDGVAIDHATGGSNLDSYQLAGWTQHFDEESGCVYFYHEKTQRTCWVPPPVQ